MDKLGFSYNENEQKNASEDMKASELKQKQIFLNETIAGILFSLSYQSPESERKITLPKKKKNREKTLFLDLDETLVHHCEAKEGSLLLSLDKDTTIGMNIRPYCVKFLSKISKIFEIFIFSAAEYSYVEAVIKFIDPKSKYISGIIAREGCSETKEGFYVKDLTRIRNRDIKDLILVDNTTFSFGKAIDNGIPIFPFTNNFQDNDLPLLAKYLLEASKYNDVREFNRQMFNLKGIITTKNFNQNDMKNLVN